jgi:hypothetical protein
LRIIDVLETSSVHSFISSLITTKKPPHPFTSA